MAKNDVKVFRIDDLDSSSALGREYASAFAFLRRSGLSRLPPGRYGIDGERVFAVISDNMLKVAGSIQRPEYHRRYADIHVPLSGEECFGMPEGIPEGAEASFDSEKDIGFFDSSCPLVKVKRGECIVIGPMVPHAPCLAEESARLHRKVIVKVAFD